MSSDPRATEPATHEGYWRVTSGAIWTIDRSERAYFVGRCREIVGAAGQQCRGSRWRQGVSCAQRAAREGRSHRTGGCRGRWTAPVCVRAGVDKPPIRGRMAELTGGAVSARCSIARRRRGHGRDEHGWLRGEPGVGKNGVAGVPGRGRRRAAGWCAAGVQSEMELGLSPDCTSCWRRCWTGWSRLRSRKRDALRTVFESASVRGRTGVSSGWPS